MLTKEEYKIISDALTILQQSIERIFDHYISEIKAEAEERILLFQDQLQELKGE